LILEPGTEGPALVVSQKGVAIYRITVEGRAAHAGVQPEAGINAIVDGCKRALAMADLALPEQGTTVNIGRISGGTEPYIVPDTCEIVLDVRVSSLSEQRRIEQGFK